mmetsp:Transcript_17594/g.48567  ORF Transcript_17594/g.48567 Transcript_17594/m.48567 type:complete len:281 (-) Transcript_17594:1293-2135(-)
MLLLVASSSSSASVKPCSTSYFSRSRSNRMAFSSSWRSSVIAWTRLTSSSFLAISSRMSITLDSMTSALLFFTWPRRSFSTRSRANAIDSASFLTLMMPCSLASSAAVALAALTFSSTSSGASVEALVIVTVCSTDVAWSFAETVRMPLLSTSNVTSIWGMPAGAGGMPSSTNNPSTLLSLAKRRSPCTTLTSTRPWLSLYVEYTLDFFIGTLVFRGMKTEQRPSCVATLSDSGMTSSSTRSRTSPVRTPACTAAPTATTSSGFTPWFGSRPPPSSRASC